MRVINSKSTIFPETITLPFGVHTVTSWEFPSLA